MIEKKFDMIEENLVYLESVRKISETKLVSGFEKIQAAKHSLQEAIEASYLCTGTGMWTAESCMRYFRKT